jgi:DNA-binding response OmpR family regulator
MDTTPHILIVDDDPRFLELLELTLTKEGYRITCALTGEEALWVIQDSRPDLVVLDIIMPGMDGWEIANRLNTITKETIPYIFLTAKGQPHHRLTGLGLGAMDYITKPFHPDRLLQIIHRVLPMKGTINMPPVARPVPDREET